MNNIIVCCFVEAFHDRCEVGRITLKLLVELDCEHTESSKKTVEQFQRDEYLRQLKGWQLVNQGKAIERNFKFKNYYHTMSFVNAIAWIANKQAHHPDMSVSYSNCKVLFTTHEINGLGLNDLICAAKVTALTESGDFGPLLQTQDQ